MMDEQPRKDLIERFSNLIVQYGGTVERIDEWGKRNLAYPINYKAIGYYVLMYWTTAENILVERCVFYDIYDSAVTHQGPGEKCDCARNLAFKHNIFLRCGMAAYEQRDKLPLSGEFSGSGVRRRGTRLFA